MAFMEEYLKFWQELGKSRKMVLPTSLNDVVTSRTMSIVILDQKLYFQTDRKFRKYQPLKGNPRTALCIDNIQIEGQCKELGAPVEHEGFCKAYQGCSGSSFHRYSTLENERLFIIAPAFIERWPYIDGEPYMQIFDVTHKRYKLEQYCGI